MKAEKKPKRPNPYRSNLGLVNLYPLTRRGVIPNPTGAVAVINRSGHQRIEQAVSVNRSIPSRKRIKTPRNSTRQPDGYYQQKTPPKHLHAKAADRLYPSS